MKLYNMNLSPNCLRIRAVANELGVDLDIVDINVCAVSLESVLVKCHFEPIRDLL